MIKINIQKKDPEVMDVYIKMSIPITNVFEFLMKKGYHVQSFAFTVPATEEILLSEPAYTVTTFTATKENQKQGYFTLYDQVFQKELISILNEI